MPTHKRRRRLKRKAAALKPQSTPTKRNNAAPTLPVTPNERKPKE